MPGAGLPVLRDRTGAFGGALKAYLSAQVEAGVLAIEDCEVAAAQFMEACLATVYKPILFNFGAALRNERTNMW